MPQDRLATINMLSTMSLHSTPEAEQLNEPHQRIPLHDIDPNILDTPSTTPESLTMERLQALLQMQKMDPFCIL